MKIQFKTKPYLNALGKMTIATPKKLSRCHVIRGTETGTRWDNYINSNLLPHLISNQISKMQLNYIYEDMLPENVTIADGFLKQITIDLGDNF